MVILENNFGVVPSKDNVAMNASEGSNNEWRSSVPGDPKAILICRRNSHPFQARTLILNTPAKIGRSVARARPSSYNGIFDCKVLSRNHAIIWYEYDTGKFMIQDTKSSNGTFVNNQRLSKGGETSSPREFFSRDVVQFGVDVLENQRKGNEESENSDESSHLEPSTNHVQDSACLKACRKQVESCFNLTDCEFCVTHGCIVATVRLFHPNGIESKSGPPYISPNPVTPISQDKICKLELLIHEAQQREEHLHDKLEELQLIIGKLEIACQEALTNRFEETRLLSKIENLEKQTKVMNRVLSGTGGKGAEKAEVEMKQLLGDIEKVQTVAREIQERQHRKLLESEQKLVEAQRVASNLELEVIALREQASLTESHLQDMGAKCTAYCQTIETLKSNFHAQIELTQKLEAQVLKFEQREADRELEMNFSEINNADKFKFISEESEESGVKNDKDSQEVILEWCKNYEESDKIEDKDFISEDDKMEWLIKKLDSVTDAMCNGLEHIPNCVGQLENSLSDVERFKKNIEKFSDRKHELVMQLGSAAILVEEDEKTENDLSREKNELVQQVILTSLSNEKITELENELKKQEESLNQERLKLKKSEGKCTKLRRELDATIRRCEKLNFESANLKTLLKNQVKSFKESANLYRQRIVKLESEVEELESGQEQKLLEVLGKNSKNMEIKGTQTSSAELISSSTNTESVEEMRLFDEFTSMTEKKTSVEDTNNSKSEILSFEVSSPNEPKEEARMENLKSEIKYLEFNATQDWSSNNLGIWEKIQKVQGVLSHQLANNSSFSNIQVTEMMNLMNLITEDLVHLLLREQQISKDKQNLLQKLNNSVAVNDTSTLGLTMHLRTIMLFSMTAIAVYFIYNIFL